MQGRVVINRNGRGEAQGSGVVIAQRRAVTAAHVVKHYAPEDIVLRLEGGAGDIGVVRVESDQELDIAILHLAADTPAVSPVTTLADGERWRVSLPVTTTDPQLTGRVSSAGRPYRTRSGDGNIFAMQLHVNETIKDYSS
ncbi:trypsin-like peptidase domain-containing protein [Streptomyces sp. CS014]|uniref:trypsin-like peptidase domain-containing protein n=1 Tax=Streptomyces sp. CS014 TaxID=2162707 RepID=UPI000D523828|nr:trypsin-like peptidase domain-containing protein [Streptomyces sp. CS014]PVC92788.1 hypothetical protein DBP12_22530 [Streptomyces sp. CS014]